MRQISRELQAHCRYSSVFANPRTFSGQKLRQKSSFCTGADLRSCMRTGALGYSAAGFNGCGQVCKSTSVSISKRKSTDAPARELRASKVMLPSSAMDTLLNQLTLAA